MNNAKLTLQLSNDSRWQLALELSENGLHLAQRVFRAAHAEALQSLYERFPRALRIPEGEDGYVDHCSRVAAGVLSHQGVRAATRADVGPRPSRMVAVALIAYHAAPLSLRSPIPLHQPVSLPPDMDEATLADTSAVWISNAFGTASELAEGLAAAGHEVLVHASRIVQEPDQRDMSEDAVQEATLSMHLSWGGLTPELVLEIVREGSVPLAARPLFSLRGKGMGLADQLRGLYHVYEARRHIPINIDVLGDNLERLSGGADVVEGLTGKWLAIGEGLYPHIWPPEVSTAVAFHRARVRDALGTSIRIAAQRTKWRDEKARGKAEAALSLDSTPLASDGEDDGLSWYETVADPSSPTYDPGVDDLLSTLRLTREERRIAEFLAAGFTKAEVAEELGVSRSAVTKHTNKVAAKLRSAGIHP